MGCYIGLHNQDIGTAFADNAGSDVLGRRFAKVVDIRFEGKPHAGHYRFAFVLFDEMLARFQYFVRTPVGLIIIGFAGALDELCLFGIVGNDEPGIYGYAMPPYTATGLQDIDAGMLVGKLYQLPYIDAGLVTDHGKFIGKGYLGITRRVLRQFAHFGRTGIGTVQPALYEG